MTSNLTSPLTTAAPESLNDIFNKDPELVTDEEIAKVVEALRADRARFVQNEKAPKAAAKTPKEKLDPNVSLEDLGL